VSTLASSTASYGVQIVAGGFFKNTAALWMFSSQGGFHYGAAISGTDTIHGVGFYDASDSPTAFAAAGNHEFGLDLSAATIAQHSIVLPNDIPVMQKNSTGTSMQILNYTQFNTLNIGEATTNCFIVNPLFAPAANDGTALGYAGGAFSDLFLASGALVDFGNGNSVVTHSSGILTVSTGDQRVTTAGTNTASAVTVGGTQTLTAKTLTSPTIDTSPTAAGATWTNLGTVTTADINGGTVDGVTIGGASAGAITGTTITANTGFMPDADDGAYLGQSGTAFSDLFLASGGVVNFAASDLTITHSTGNLTFSNGNYIWSGLLRPASNDGAQLGHGSFGWADLFLASGGLVNWADGNFTLTHATGKLTASGPVSVSGTVAGIYSGSGSPEGVVTAEPGSIYLNTAGGTDTSLYTKGSGSSNTGWVAVDNV
jgi:hypothetical protein